MNSGSRSSTVELLYLTKRVFILELVLVVASCVQANFYVRKPTDFDQFHQIISQIGQFWKTINKPFSEEF